MKKTILLTLLLFPVFAFAQNVGIGTNAPLGKLHINLTGDANLFALIIDDDDADNTTVRLRKAGVSKSFLMQAGDDLRIGTYATNPNGGLLFQTNSTNRVFIASDGNTGMGTLTPTARLHIATGTDASLASNGYLLLGTESSANLTLDNNEIQARSNGAASTLFLQGGGGATRLGSVSNSNIELNNTTVSAFFNGASETLILQPNGKTRVGSAFDFSNTKLHVSEGVDAGLATNQSGFLMLGTSNTENLVFDNNEILARNNGAGGNLNLQRDGGDLIIMANNNAGRIGVSTASPFTKLHIATGQDAGLNNTNNGYIMLGSATGSNLIIDNNEIIARSNVLPAGQGTDLFIQNDGGNVLLCGNEQGGVGIGILSGTSIPLGYMLAVDGRIISEELKVQLSGSWPDYVFAENYNLRPMDELRSFISKNKHLPGIPSATEMEKNGIEVGDMQKRMIEKIEELTLYVLKLEEEITKLKNKTN